MILKGNDGSTPRKTRSSVTLYKTDATQAGTNSKSGLRVIIPMTASLSNGMAAMGFGFIEILSLN
jgi:hypothetical protein